MLASFLPDWNTPNNASFKRNDSELKIQFKGGGWLYLIGADRPDLMRGPNPYGVVMDEYSVTKKEIWTNVVQPLMLVNLAAWCWFLFTPRGKNHAFDIALKAKDNNDWQYSALNIYQSGLFTPEQIEKIKTEMIPSSFQQEMMCEFLEGEGSVFRHVRDIAISEPEKPQPGHLYVMGVDLGKSQDYTVITVYDRHTNRQVYQSRFNILEWPYQKAKIEAISRAYNKALTVIDATGIGSPIYDDLVRSGIPLIPFKFTNQSKKEIIEKLSISIEQRYIKIINLPETLDEFDSFEFNYTKLGQVTYNARDGMHDDIVISHALAVSQLYPLPKDAIVEELTPLQAHLQNLLKPPDMSQLENEWANSDN